MFTKGVTLLHVNIRSIYRKIHQLNLLYNTVDFLCCTETWLDHRFPDNLVDLDNMKIFRMDRKSNTVTYHVKNTGGGVCIYVGNSFKDHTSIFNAGTKTTVNFETLTVMVNRANFKKMAIICVYKPPKGNVQVLIDFLKDLLRARDFDNRDIWILGDWNINWLKRDDPNTVKIFTFCKFIGYTQLIDSITRPNKKGGTAIDLILTNSAYVMVSGVRDDMLSDHFTIYAIRKKKRERKIMSWMYVRDYKNFNPEIFSTLLGNQNRVIFKGSIDPNVQWHEMIKNVGNILSIMSPFKRIFARMDRPLWITPEIHKAIRERKDLFKNFMISRKKEDLELLHRKRNSVNSLVDKAKANFIKSRLYQTRKNPRKFWITINSLIKERNNIDVGNIVFRDPENYTLITQDQKPDFLNRFFVDISENTRGPDHSFDLNMANCYSLLDLPGFDFTPPDIYDIRRYFDDIDMNMSSCIDGVNMKICKLLLTDFTDMWLSIFANSMFTGIFPEDWSRSIVTLLPKGGDLTNPVNWRPISQTNIFSKILEKIVHSKILDYFLRNSILSRYQYGFLPGRSTQEAVYDVVKNIYSSLNNRKIMGTIFLDISKAFNCIHHGRLYKKMRFIGFLERCISWFKSYLTRTQSLRIGSETSPDIDISAGIAQGTVLGPLIFIFYLNDIIYTIKRCHISLFADDCILYFDGNNWTHVFDVIQRDLLQIEKWCGENALKINPSKTKAMVMGSRLKLSRINFTPKFCLNGKDILFVNHFTYLGVILDNEMSLKPLLSGVEDKKDLKIMQNDALRFCYNVRLLDRVSIVDLHSRAKLASLEQRRIRQLLGLQFLLYKKDTDRHVARVNTRSQQKYVFKVDTKIGKKYERSPYYLGTRLWDKLERNIQYSENVHVFKKKIARLYKCYNEKYL